jgi:hypothetical protein
VATTTYEPQLFANLDADGVRDRLRSEGWDPVPIQDRPGYVYPPHSHAETKVLAFLAGSMEVRVGAYTYRCLPGDRVVIPGGVEHAALVGPEGCTFFWSEQLR